MALLHLAYDYAMVGDDTTGGEDERRDAMRNGPMPVFVEKRALRPGLAAETGADIMWTLIDPALYYRLVHRAGWTPEQFREWLVFTIRTQVLKPEPSDPAGRSGRRTGMAASLDEADDDSSVRT